MNKHILVAMDRKNRTKKELLDNVASASAAYSYSYAAAAADAAAAAAAASTYAAERWINEYFEVTGENKQDYIDAIEVSK